MARISRHSIFAGTSCFSPRYVHGGTPIFRFLVQSRLFKTCYHVSFKYSKRWRSTDVIYNLLRRGLVKEIFPKDVAIKSTGMPCAYAGFDSTSDSLHIGNLLILVALIHWQRAGNQSVIVIGDATAQIGDPSGHKTDRDALASDVIGLNADSIEKSIHRIFANHENFLWCRRQSQKKQLTPIRVFRNSSWYNDMKIVDLIASAGRGIRIGEMLSRTSVKSRMETGEGINFSEFSYQLFQSYDWLHLFEKYNCQFQFGGSDQFGNILTGYQLITGTHYKSVYGVLLPLVQSESGDKYGKTAGNAVYLNADKMSPFDLYQFFLRLQDAEVEKFLKLFTFLSPEEVEDVVQKHMKSPDTRYGQRKIAEEVLLLVHGDTGLESAKRTTKAFYESDLDSLTKMSITEIKQILPTSSLIELPFEHGLSLLTLTLKAKCFLEEVDANRIIQGGGVYLNFLRTSSPSIVITPGVHILPNGTTLIRIGKKTYYLVIWK